MTKDLLNDRRSWLYACIMLLLLLTPLLTHAQTSTITGIVTSDDGSPLPGVSVLVKGTSVGTVTDADGKYSINASGDATLVYSFIGMKATEVAVNGRSSIDLPMENDISQLDEVVVVGYGTQKKTDVTGSVSSVSSKEIKATPVASISQALQGRAAGVQVSQTSNAPGGGMSIRIRGGNSIQGGNEPLYVIDGFPLYNENGPNISPNDIESMEILKDASATAIYGSRGANGVVIITTKRGRANTNMVQFESYYGVQNVRKKLDMLNATQLAELVNEGITNVNPAATPAFTSDQIAALGKGTDWQDEIFRAAPQQNYQLTFSGGSNTTQYAISGNYFRQDGIVVNSDYERSSIRINLDQQLYSKFKLSNSLTITRSKANAVSTDGDGGSGAGVVYSALNFSPTIPAYTADGSYTVLNRIGGIKINSPLPMAYLNTNKTIGTRIIGNISGEYEIIDGLKFKVLLGANLNLSKNSTYVSGVLTPGGVASIGNAQSSEWLNENTLTYQKSFNEVHKLTALVGYTLQNTSFSESRMTSLKFNNDLLQYNSMVTAQQADPNTSNTYDFGLRSYLGRINYDYDGRYLLTLTARVDGASRFGRSNKNSVFPSGSVAWRISQENFMTNVSAISDLKIRASYGVTGNQQISQYMSLPALAPFSYSFNNSLAVGYGPTRIANPNLKWETTNQANIGLDIGLLNDRIVLTADIYEKKTKDLLYTVSLPITTGYSTSLQNIGKVQNRGIEFSVNTVNMDKEFKWSTNFNIAANRTKILDLGAVKGDIPSGGASGHLQLGNSGILRVGEPIGVFYGLVTDGIFQNQAEVDASAQKTAKPGERRFKDMVPDGVINSSDRVILGHASPDYIFGFTNNFSYKGFDLSVFFQGVQGNSIFNINRYELESLTGISNQSTAVLDRWTPENPSNTIPRATSTGYPYQVTSRQIEDGSYIRLKNIQLAYNFPSTWLERIKLTSAKFYVSGQNLLTITDYSGFDPEVSRYGQDNLSLGTDYGSYPTSKMYLVGLNIGF